MSDTATFVGGPLDGQSMAPRPDAKHRIQIARLHPVQEDEPAPSDFVRSQFGWYEVRPRETESDPLIYAWLGWDE